MSTMPKVSVVTTTYNDMDNLCRIMEEVRKQTYKNIEHIILDGGTTDGPVEMMTRLSEEQPGDFYRTVDIYGNIPINSLMLSFIGTVK